MDITTAEPRYVLGHSDHELRRLRYQSRYWSEATLSLLQAAGIRPGMRVLDLGCGAGDLSFMVASMVGPEGSVIGVDRAHEAIVTARARAARLGFSQTEFRRADVSAMVLDSQIDAIVGRFVLMYLGNPGQSLRRLVAQLRPGAIVAVLEMDMTTARSVPPAPLYDGAIQRVQQAFTDGGVPLDLGSNLWQIYLAAGLGMPRLQTHIRVEAAPAAETSRYLAETTETLAALRSSGAYRLQHAEEPSLEERLMRELSARRSTTVSPMVIGAWARKPEIIEEL